MDESNASENVTRRLLLKSVPAAAGMAISFGPAAVLDVALAQTKMSHDAAKYQDTPKNGQQCSNCVLFIPPSDCKVVESPVSSDGWCQLYAKKP